MPILKLLYIGTINIGYETVFTSHKGTQQECILDLNNWIFDYCYAHGIEIQQLPPLDDWEHELNGWWSYYRLTEPRPLSVALHSELIAFP